MRIFAHIQNRKCLDRGTEKARGRGGRDAVDVHTDQGRGGFTHD
jgi:hypothetical protein